MNELLTEVVNSYKAPFTTLPAESTPRPAVMAATWLLTGLLLNKVL